MVHQYELMINVFFSALLASEYIFIYFFLHSLVNICFVSTLIQMKILFKFELNLTTVFVLIYSSAKRKHRSLLDGVYSFLHKKRDKNKHFHSIVVVIYGNTSLSDAPTFLALFDRK